jgi:hypothetical protein
MASFDRNEQRNLQYECKIGTWSKVRPDISEVELDAAENAKIIRQLTQQILTQKEEKRNEFLKLTKQRNLLQRKRLEENMTITNTANVKNKKILKQMTSFEQARNNVCRTQNLLNSRFSSP